MAVITELLVGVNILISLMTVCQRSRCTEIKSKCCFDCFELDLERSVVEAQPVENVPNVPKV